MKKLIVICMILACAWLAGCSKFGGDKGSAMKDSVVAQVGDEKITAGDIEEILSHIPPQYRGRYSTSQGRKEIVDGLLNIKMLAWEARNRGLDKKDSVRVKISYLTDQALAKELENELRKSYKVSDAEIEKYYSDHPEKYVTPDRIKASHILVETEAQAQDILNKVKKGADFAQLAKQYSKDTASAQRGGDLGWFGKGRMDPEFEKAALALKKGEMSGVVKTAFGYHVIRLDDRRETTRRSLDQVRKSIERIIQRERIQKEVDGLKQGIRKNAKVAVNEDYFRKFTSQAPKEAGEAGMPMPGPGIVPGTMRGPVRSSGGTAGPAPVQGPVQAPAPAPGPLSPAPAGTGK